VIEIAPVSFVHCLNSIQK